VQRKGSPGREELKSLSEHAESTERVDAAHDYQSHIEEGKPTNPTSSRQGIDTKEEVKCAKKRRNESVPSEQSTEMRYEWDINKSDDYVKESNGETQEGSPEEPCLTWGSHNHLTSIFAGSRCFSLYKFGEQKRAFLAWSAYLLISFGERG
jgi:hypothetical protein